MRQAARIVLNKPKFDYLRDLFEDRRNPVATRLHYALSCIEDDMINALSAKLSSHFGASCRVMVLMFDGLIIETKGVTGEEIEIALKDFGESRKMTFSLRAF